MFAIYEEPAKAAEQIVIVNHQGILGSMGYFNVVGEVKNIGDTAAKNVNVRITFTSSEGDDVDEMDTLIHVICREENLHLWVLQQLQGRW